MAITITKPAITKVKQVELASAYAEQIDALGKLQLDFAKAEQALVAVAAKELDRVKSLATKIKEAKTALEASLDQIEGDPDKVLVERGAKYQAELGKRGNERKITDLKLIHDILEYQEDGLFFKLGSIKLGDIDQYLTPQEKEATIETTRGKRTIKVTKRT